MSGRALALWAAAGITIAVIITALAALPWWASMPLAAGCVLAAWAAGLRAEARGERGGGAGGLP